MLGAAPPRPATRPLINAATCALEPEPDEPPPPPPPPPPWEEVLEESPEDEDLLFELLSEDRVRDALARGRTLDDRRAGACLNGSMESHQSCSSVSRECVLGGERDGDAEDEEGDEGAHRGEIASPRDPGSIQWCRMQSSWYG